MNHPNQHTYKHKPPPPEPHPIEVHTTPQPRLQDIYGDLSPVNDGNTQTPWHPATIDWWDGLANWPTTKELHAVQWQELARIAVLTDAVNKGQLKYAATLRASLEPWLLTPSALRKAKIDTAPTEATEVPEWMK